MGAATNQTVVGADQIGLRESPLRRAFALKDSVVPPRPRRGAPLRGVLGPLSLQIAHNWDPHAVQLRLVTHGCESGAKFLLRPP